MNWPAFDFYERLYASSKPDWEWTTRYRGRSYQVLLQFFKNSTPRLYLLIVPEMTELYAQMGLSEDKAIAQAEWMRENLPVLLMEIAL